MAEKEIKEKEWADRWGVGVIDNGWTIVPSLLFQSPKLKKIDLLVVLNIVNKWHSEDDLPPKICKNELAKRVGCTDATLRASIGRLEQLDFLRRIETTNDDTGGRGANRYDLSGLIDYLQEVAVAK